MFSYVNELQKKVIKFIYNIYFYINEKIFSLKLQLYIFIQFSIFCGRVQFNTFYIKLMTQCTQSSKIMAFEYFCVNLEDLNYEK